MSQMRFESISHLFGSIEADKPIVIAGPCSAESEESVVGVAKGVASAGAVLFRAGLWKPRTRPGTFEGVGARGLPWLRKARNASGLKVITEVARREHVVNVVRGGCDAVWIGARTTADPFAVQEIAEALCEFKADIPVFVKNPVNPDIELWIGALERLYAAGIRRLAVVHRGFSRYGDTYYRNSPLWQIPIELKRRMPSLPLFHDPSHCGGRRDMVATLSQQALDLGFDGLMIESHPDPVNALSDSSQQVTPEELGEIIGNLRMRDNLHAPSSLEGFRERLDTLDSRIVELLAERMNVCREIGKLKEKHGMSVVQRDRYSRLLSSHLATGKRMGLDDKFLRQVFSSVHAESVRLQLEIMKDGSGESSPKE